MALSCAPAAFAQSGQTSYQADLDGDPDLETVRAAPIANPQDPGSVGIAAEINDVCPATGTSPPIRIAGPQDKLGYLRLIDADTNVGQEVVVDLRSGAGSRVGEAKLVALRLQPVTLCGSPRELYSYTSSRPTKKPSGARQLANFGMSVRELEGNFGGKEILLDEAWTAKRDAPCCPSIHKLSYYHYNSALDHYVRYKSRVQRRAPGKRRSN